MSHGTALDHPGPLQFDVIGGEPVEHPDATAQQHRHQIDLDLIEQARGDHLLHGFTAHHLDGASAGGGPGRGDRLIDAAGDEGEASAGHHQCVVRSMGHHEAGDRIGDVRPDRSPDIEGSPAQHHGADRCPLLLRDLLVAWVLWVGKQPAVQQLSALTQWVGGAGVGAGHEAVQGHAHVN